MFETLFGAEMPLAMRFFIAFIVVLALIGAFFWLMRRFGAERLGGGANRGRQPRLAVIDAAAVDSRRRLVLIRRDNVEHLLMIGGPSDVVVEANIVRAAAPQREMPAPRTAEALPRQVAAAEPAWAPQPEPVRPAARSIEEPVAPWSAEPEPAPPPVEPPPVRRPEPVARLQRNQDSPLTTFSSDLHVRSAASPDIGAIRPAPMVERMPSAERRDRLAERLAAVDRTPVIERGPAAERLPAAERAAAPERAPAPERPAPVQAVAALESAPTPPPAASAPAPEPLPAAADQNLAEMAQRLEAALRRPGQAEPRPERRTAGEPVAASEAPIVPAPAERPAAPSAGEPRAKPKTLYDSLEQEMASLLGRPAGKP